MGVVIVDAICKLVESTHTFRCDRKKGTTVVTHCRIEFAKTSDTYSLNKRGTDKSEWYFHPEKFERNEPWILYISSVTLYFFLLKQ